MHSPACPSWEAHVEKSYAALREGDDYNLLSFTDYLMHSYDNERLADDPEFPFERAEEWDNHPRFAKVSA